ncbi:MAG TPA: FadR/GntR family transcriptional regulator [Chloroflexota bacterium]|nr:FadR/GntR family transcriptional regulator [Chloroflexota bacterium]
MKKNRSQGLHGRVIHDLGRRIVSGEFTAGAPLPGQEECCALLGVSRSVLREALRVLAAKGLVEARPKAGTFVRPREAWNFLDSDVLEWRLQTPEFDKVMDQLYELRQMVEPVGAFLAASKAKLPDFQKIGQAYEEMAAAGDDEHVVEPDLKFHRAIIAASGNDLFASLGRVVEAALLVSFRIGVDNPKGQAHSLEMHKAILDAIVDRDGPAARLAMQKLIEYSKQTMLLIRANRRGKRRTKTRTPKPSFGRTHDLTTATGSRR